MRKACLLLALAAAFLVGYLTSQREPVSEAGEKKTHAAKIGHMVYFTLKDNSAAEKGKLVDACKKYLTKHHGEVYFAAGVLAEDLKREVNVRDWDVALHIVFADMKSHDAYQTADRHKQFITENKDNWKQVRVFDSVID
ncbi:MAG: Dabb family protein [Gemmataceae bacterium]